MEHANGAQVVVDTIQHMILSGELMAGDKLPAERTMTETLAVGRPALREGLKALELMGILERRRGSGNYVASAMGQHVFTPLSLAYKLNNGTLEDVLEMRYALECFSIGRACLWASEEQLHQLQQLHESMLGVEDLPTRAELDWQFHYQIAAMSGNVLVTTFLKSTSYLMNALFSKTVQQALQEDVSFGTVYQEHQEILDALWENSPHKGIAAIQNHLDHISRTYLEE